MKKITGPFFGLIVTASLILAQTAPLPDSPWHFMDTQRIGAYDLLKSHPTFDGRGVIIIICDSGVDMGVQGLLLTSEGKTKVLDAQDFSGQGDIKLQKAKLDSTGYKPALKTESILLYDFDLLPHQPADSIYWVGCLDEKKYFQNAGPKDINNNGKEDDKFGVVTFPISINDEERWVYFVDENGDGSHPRGGENRLFPCLRQFARHSLRRHCCGLSAFWRRNAARHRTGRAGHFRQNR